MRIFTLWITFLLLLVCPAPLLAQEHPGQIAETTIESETPAERALQRALDHYHEGKLNEAAGLLRGFVVSQTDSPLLDRAYYYLARIHADLDEPAIAADYLARQSAQQRTPEEELLSSALLLRVDNPALAVDRLLQSDVSRWSLDSRQERFILLAEGLLLLEQPQRALYFYHLAQQTEGAKTPQQVLEKIHDQFSDNFSKADLAEAAFMYINKPVGYLATLQLGWRALAAGDKSAAKEWAAATLSSPPGFAYREEALMLQSQLVDPNQFQRAIGVLLPLSGRYESFGALVRQGMDLAMEIYRPNIPVRFIYRDTAGDELTAGQQLAELAIRDRVLGIAGPLVGNAALGAAQRAERERIPLLAMSQKEGLTESSRYVFRNALTPRLQVRTLVDYAFDEMGFTEYGILSPRTRQGALFAELFLAEVTARGGRVVVQQNYATDQTDFRVQTRSLRGLDPIIPEDEEELAAEEAAPAPFDVLFLPDYADRVKLIVPQLAFYGLDEVQLLGVNGWNNSELPRVAGQFLEGAVFTDGFFRHSNYPFVQDFVEHYFRRYNSEPTILEAQGYDIASILLTLLDSSEVRNREDLQRAMHELQNYPGVTGATSFDEDGRAEKVLFLLQIQDNVITQIN